MKSKLDKQSVKGPCATLTERLSTFIKRGGQSVVVFLSASLYRRGICPLIFGERDLISIERLRRQCAHLKRTSHAKMKYGMSSFAIELNVESFAWHTSFSAFLASY